MAMPYDSLNKELGNVQMIEKGLALQQFTLHKCSSWIWGRCLKGVFSPLLATYALFLSVQNALCLANPVKLTCYRHTMLSIVYFKYAPLNTVRTLSLSNSELKKR